ncbi:MAG TPA: RHS repeat-associated core domain-containing protein, partial [Cytophagaceae bacterium]
FEELHGFTGKEYDPDIGLYYFNARWYDPDLGRFISEDPAGQGPNPYSYCGNDPINRIDPDGQFFGALLGAVWGAIKKSFVTSIVQGVISQITGGDFLQSFAASMMSAGIAGGVSSLTGSIMDGTSLGRLLGGSDSIAYKAVSTGISSGLTSVAYGGDFTSAFWTGSSNIIKGAIQDTAVGLITNGVNSLQEGALNIFRSMGFIGSSISERFGAWQRMQKEFYRWLDSVPHVRFGMEGGLEFADKFMMRLWHMQQRQHVNLSELSIDELDAIYWEEVRDQNVFAMYHGVYLTWAAYSKMRVNEITKGQNVFPKDPRNFNPKGLIRREYNNGKIIKWHDPKTGKAVYEWNADAAGGHYHITPDGKHRIPHPDTKDTHIKPGQWIP